MQCDKKESKMLLAASALGYEILHFHRVRTLYWRNGCKEGWKFTANGYECSRNALHAALDTRSSWALMVIYYEIKSCVTDRQLMTRYVAALDWVLLFLVRFIFIRNIEIYFR